MRGAAKPLLDLVSAGGAMIGSLLIATNTSLSKYGYIFCAVGAVASVAIMRGSNVRRSQIVINVWYVLVNLFGIVRWFEILR